MTPDTEDEALSTLWVPLSQHNSSSFGLMEADTLGHGLDKLAHLHSWSVTALFLLQRLLLAIPLTERPPGEGTPV